MSNGNLSKTGFLLFAALFATACGGKSNATGEVVPLERVCAYQKAQTVAVEGFLAPNTMRCEKARGKRTSSISGCTFTVYANSDKTGASIPVFISADGWYSGKNNRIVNPSNYPGDMQFTDRNGKPLPKKELEIYDNDGNLIPSGSKIRVYSKLPNSDKCEFRLAERIERVETEPNALNTEKMTRNFIEESF
ncbi:MAG TPA: hypothetical protein VF599_14230 [Pyrinomonadaceae bacterium]|jgi:hypothetical protein